MTTNASHDGTLENTSGNYFYRKQLIPHLVISMENPVYKKLRNALRLIIDAQSYHVLKTVHPQCSNGFKNLTT